MDDKIFALLETMYADLTSKIDNGLKELQAIMATKDDLSNMATKDDLSNMATKNDIIRLENKMDENHKALYDGYKLTYEKLEVLEEKVNQIEKKVEKQDVEIRVIKSVM